MLYTCYHCHTEYDTDNVLIPCGKIWERNVMRCPKCGIEEPDHDDFVPWIGLTVSQLWEAKLVGGLVVAVLLAATFVQYTCSKGGRYGSERRGASDQRHLGAGDVCHDPQETCTKPDGR